MTADAPTKGPGEPLDDAIVAGGDLGPTDDLARFALLQVRDQLLAIQGTFSKGIVHIDSMLNVPGSPPYVAGAHYRRGRILPVLDLARALHAGTTAMKLPAATLEVAVEDCEIALLCESIVGFELADPKKLTRIAEPATTHGPTAIAWELGELVFRQGTATVVDMARLIPALKMNADAPATLASSPSLEGSLIALGREE